MSTSSNSAMSVMMSGSIMDISFQLHEYRYPTSDLSDSREEQVYHA